MRQGSSAYYLYGDHLGSTSLITNASGATLTETRYEPYGQPSGEGRPTGSGAPRAQTLASLVNAWTALA